jgi:Xaa-Pro aminopeptidase
LTTGAGAFSLLAQPETRRLRAPSFRRSVGCAPDAHLVLQPKSAYLLANLRAAHRPEELERMERAIAITAERHNAVARATVAGVSERDVQTQLEYAFFAAGGTGLSYSSIVGSGPNGAVLHWDKNSRVLQNGDLVVVDAAAVEPGVYLPAQGFGVRIEDEVLITDHGYRMLTSSIPRKLELVRANERDDLSHPQGRARL